MESVSYVGQNATKPQMGFAEPFSFNRHVINREAVQPKSAVLLSAARTALSPAPVTDDLDFVQITNRGSNRLPDWHALEEK